jgi:tRNA G18 (ribose-2'-O)-methylase SpoU
MQTVGRLERIMSGYFEIGIYHTKTKVNVGTLFRSAWQLGASGVFTIGRRYSRQASDTYNTTRNIPLRHYVTFDEFLDNRPVGALLVGVEMGGKPLSEYSHPRNAIYLLGAEDHGLPQSIMSRCNSVVSLQAVRRASYNVAVAGSLVLYHREFCQPPNYSINATVRQRPAGKRRDL